jgi:hypothetical protein
MVLDVAFDIANTNVLKHNGFFLPMIFNDDIIIVNV